MSSKFLRHEPCPKCGSSNNVGVWEDGGKHCFSQGCDYHVFSDGTGEQEFQQRNVSVGSTVTLTGVVADIPDRRISAATCHKYNVRVCYGPTGAIEEHQYPYYNKDTGDLQGFKVRYVDRKDFVAKGAFNGTGLFGQETCKGHGKYITITEGEVDALSVSEMFDRKWDVVSLRNGASGAAKEIKENLEFLEGYDQVVLCFDNDSPGRAALDAVKDLFQPNKLKIVKLPTKDASDMLVANRVKEFVQCWWNASVYRPDGIVAGVDTWERIVERRNVKSVQYPWEGLNALTRGFRLGELVTITSGSGMGKSQLIREIEYYLLRATESNIGVIALEEDISRTALGIMSVAANYPLHLDEELDKETLRTYWEQTLGSGRYYLFDHWGSTGIDNLLSRIRYLAKSLDCDYIILDHLSIVVSAQDNNDERKAIDEIMTKLRTLVQELDISLFLVSHLRRASGTAHEDGARISLGELRGSQSIAQLSDIVLGLERDQQHADPQIRNTSTVRVLKNRYSGQTGPACYLLYDTETGRMREVAAPAVEEKDF